MSRVDAKRGAIGVLLLVTTFGAWFLVMPWIQVLFIPKAVGGAKGPWIIRPILAMHVCACFIAAAVSMPLFTRGLRERRKAQDAAAGTRYDPFRRHPLLKIVHFKGYLLILVYAAALLFYLFSWTIVSPAGIEERFPWGSRAHRFDQIYALETIPSGEHNETLQKTGPWFNVTFRDGRSFSFGHDNEGLSESESAAIAKYLAERSGKEWQTR
jgi:hypothetical protein